MESKMVADGWQKGCGMVEDKGEQRDTGAGMRRWQASEEAVEGVDVGDHVGVNQYPPNLRVVSMGSAGHMDVVSDRAGASMDVDALQSCLRLLEMSTWVAYTTEGGGGVRGRMARASVLDLYDVQAMRKVRRMMGAVGLRASIANDCDVISHVGLRQGISEGGGWKKYTPGPRERWNYDLDNEEIPICETHLQVENPMPSIPLQRGSLSLAYISVDGHYTLEDRSCIHKQCRWSSCSETLKRLLALLKLKGTVKIVYYSRRAL
ncbi:hypothetical protein BC827DRAFT_1158549 [Russula dissimulans]|nr:hypothetical protein BC827DRAFT_1158549 [Russula dissimulans]